MKATYPIIIHQADQTGYHFVEIPDFGGFTQGKDLNDCLEMAQDYINLSVIDLEDHNAPIPLSSGINCLELGPRQVKSLVAIDTVSYRREKNSCPVKKTLTIPSWLNKKAEQNNINFSQTLQEALINKLYQ